MQIIVFTSDHYLWLLQGFAHLFNKYWGDNQGVEVVGFSPPEFKLPSNFKFHSIGKFHSYPPVKWSDALLVALKDVAEKQFLLLLEDYWLYRHVDVEAIKMLFGYASQFDYVLKIDVTNERINNDWGRYQFGHNTYAHLRYLDLIRSLPGSTYQMSLWGGIWNREQMLKFVIPGERAQEIELRGTPRVNAAGDNVLVLGTRQSPLLHANVIQSGKPGQIVLNDVGWSFSVQDIADLNNKGFLKRG